MTNLLRCFLLSIFLTTSLLPIQSANANSKIDRCSKAGTYKTKDKIKYICVKKNNIKLWVKAPIKNLPKSKEPSLEKEVSPTTTPINIDTSIDYKTKRDLYNKYKKLSNSSASVYEQWRDGFDTINKEDNLIYFISPRFTETGVNTIKSRLNNSVNQLNKYAPVERIKVFVEVGFPEDIAGICDRVSLRSTHINPIQCSSKISDAINKEPYLSAGTIDSEGNFAPIFDLTYSANASVSIVLVVSTEESLYNWLAYAILEHEYFHIVQKDEAGIKQAEQYPCWLHEGSASYFSLLNSTIYNPDAFTQFRSKYFSWIINSLDSSRTTPSLEYLRIWVESVSVKYKGKDAHSDSCSPLTDGDKIYNQGALLTEWMIGKIGFNNFFLMMREIEVLGFEQAFEKFFTKSLEKSYDEMAEYLYKENNLILDNYHWLNKYNCYYFLDEVNGFCTNNFKP